MMLLEKQVVSLELSKKLKSLNVKQESFFWWNKNSKTVELVWDEKDDCDMSEFYSAFTVAELGAMLPQGFSSGRRDAFGYRCTCQRMTIKACYGKNEADARGKMLVYLIEQGLVKP